MDNRRLWITAPEADERVRSPGPPAFGVPLQRGGGVGETEGPRAAADGQIGGQEDVGVANRAHGDVTGGPAADAGQVLEAGRGFVAVRARVEVQFAVGYGLGEGAEGGRLVLTPDSEFFRFFKDIPQDVRAAGVR